MDDDSRGLISDEEVTRRLHDELAGKPWLQNNPISITVQQGIVHLSGAVPDLSIAQAFVNAAQNAAGSDKVRDDLLVIDALAASALVLG